MKERTKLIMGGTLKPLVFGIPGIFMIMLISFPFITGTETSEFAFIRETDQIECISLVYVPEQTDVDEFSLGFLASVVPCQALPDSQITHFLADFRAVTCYENHNHPSPSILHGSIHVTYADGSWELLSAGGTLFQSGTGRRYTYYHFDENEFLALLEKYGYQEPQ